MIIARQKMGQQSASDSTRLIPFVFETSLTWGRFYLSIDRLVSFASTNTAPAPEDSLL
jgi:hypothetical protein